MTVKFTNLAEFQKKLHEFQRKTQLAPGKVARRICFQVLGGVIERTPVDKGWAQVNWNIAEGTPDASLNPPKPPKDPLPNQNSRALAAQKNAGVNKTVEFPRIWISNNVPYIVPLENGHSKQAGKGYMVQRTLVDVQADLEKELRDLE